MVDKYNYSLLELVSIEIHLDKHIKSDIKYLGDAKVKSIEDRIIKLEKRLEYISNLKQKDIKHKTSDYRVTLKCNFDELKYMINSVLVNTLKTKQLKKAYVERIVGDEFIKKYKVNIEEEYKIFEE